MDRKMFIRKTSAGILLAIPAIGVLGCSSSDDGVDGPGPDPAPTPVANCLENGTAVSIGANHGHNLTVSKADVTAGSEKTYTLTTGNGHTHEVTLTANHFAALQENNSITATSTNDGGHTHSVTVSCATA